MVYSRRSRMNVPRDRLLGNSPTSKLQTGRSPKSRVFRRWNREKFRRGLESLNTAKRVESGRYPEVPDDLTILSAQMLYRSRWPSISQIIPRKGNRPA